jgi:hypothetical protein
MLHDKNKVTKVYNPYSNNLWMGIKTTRRHVSGTIIRGTLKAPNSQLVTPISIKLQRPDGCD